MSIENGSHNADCSGRSGGWHIVVAALLVFCFATDVVEARETTITGQAIALDGDTLVIAGHPRRVRLHAIDTPEMADWPAGRDARRVLDRMIDGQLAASIVDGLLNNTESAPVAESGVTCLLTGADKYKRDVGICWAGYPAVVPSLTDPAALAQSLNARLLASCHAVTYRTFLAWPPDAITTAFLAAERSCGPGE